MNRFRRLRIVLTLFAAMVCGVGLRADDVSKPEGPFRVLGRYQGVTQLTVSHDGGLVAYVSNNRLTLSDTVEGPIRITFPWVMSYVNNLDFSPDGKVLAAGNMRSVKLIDTQTGKEIRSIVHDNYFQMYAVKFSPDGKRIAVSGGTLYHNYLGIFEVATGELLTEPLKDHGSPPFLLSFSPRGRYLAINFRSSVMLVDSDSGMVVNTIKNDSELAWFGPPVEGASGKDSEVLFSFSKGALTSAPVIGAQAGVRPAVKVVPDWSEAKRSHTYTSARGWVAIGEDQNVTLYDTTGKEQVFMNGRGRGRVARIAFSKDGRIAAIGRDNGTVDIWKL